MQRTEYSAPPERPAGNVPFRGLRRPPAVPGKVKRLSLSISGEAGWYSTPKSCSTQREESPLREAGAGDAKRQSIQRLLRGLPVICPSGAYAGPGKAGGLCSCLLNVQTAGIYNGFHRSAFSASAKLNAAFSVFMACGSPLPGKAGALFFAPRYLSACALPVSRHFPPCPENLRAQRKRFYAARSAGDFRLQQNSAPCRAQRRQGAPAFQKNLGRSLTQRWYRGSSAEAPAYNSSHTARYSLPRRTGSCPRRGRCRWW